MILSISVFVTTYSFFFFFFINSQVEVIDWQKEDLSTKKDGGILRNIIEAGEGHSTPNDGSMVDGMLF